MIHFRQSIPIVLLLSVAGCNLLPSDNNYTVQQVYDGDTIAVSQGEKIGIVVYFACIKTPLFPHTNKDRDSKYLVDKNHFSWGIKARSRVLQLVERGGDRIVLNITKRNRAGILVAEVRLPDGTFIQETLIREGLALVDRQRLQYCPSKEIIEQAEIDAKKNLRGVWKDSQFVAPGDFRRINPF